MSQLSQDFESYQEIENFINLPENSSVYEWYVTGRSGTGKTTQFTKFLAKNRKTVFVCLPTKTSVFAAYNYVKTKYDDVGYGHGWKTHYDNSLITTVKNCLFGKIEQLPGRNTSLVFCTNSHLRTIIKDIYRHVYNIPNSKKRAIKNFCDYLVIDEVHLKNKDQEMIRMFWTLLNNSFSGVLEKSRLIKMSSVVPTDEVFVLSYINRRIIEPRIYYMDSMIPGSSQKFEKRFRTERGNIDIPGLIFFMLTEIKNQYDEISFERGETYNFVGTILIFVSGYSKIMGLKKVMEYSQNVEKLLRITNGFEILIAHSSLTDEEMQELLGPRKENWRIIISTDICETSITIPGVVLVIDTMKRKSVVEGNYNTLILKEEYISKNSAYQRSHRSGRDVRGVAIRLITEKQYLKLKNEDESELKRLPIINEVLEVINLELHPETFFTDVENNKKISKLKEELKRLDCVKVNNFFIKKTERGIFCEEMPLSIYNSCLLHKLMLRCINEGNNFFPLIVAVVAIESYDSLLRYDYNNIYKYPLETFMYPFLKYLKLSGKLEADTKKIFQICSRYNVNFDEMRDSIGKILEIIQYCKDKVSIELEREISVEECFNDIVQECEDIFEKLERDDEGNYKNKDGKIFIVNTKFNKHYYSPIYALTVKKIEKDLLVDVAIPSYFFTKNSEYFEKIEGKKIAVDNITSQEFVIESIKTVEIPVQQEETKETLETRKTADIIETTLVEDTVSPDLYSV